MADKFLRLPPFMFAVMCCCFARVSTPILPTVSEGGEVGAVTLASILMQERVKVSPVVPTSLPCEHPSLLGSLFLGCSVGEVWLDLSTCKTWGSTDSPVTQKWLSEARNAAFEL